MSIPINTNYSAGLAGLDLAGDLTRSFWNKGSESKEADSVWGLMAEQCNYKVSVGMQNVGDKLLLDLAGVTAQYLADKPDLSEDYVVAVVNSPTGGWEARAFRRSDLAADLEEGQKEDVMAALDETPLLYATDPDDLPETPADDEVLLGLANQVQGFLDKNKDVLQILAREGFLPFD